MPGTASLSVLPHSSAENGSVTVKRKAVLPATADAIIPRPTATGDGTHTGNLIDRRTTVERSNKREKEDYKLEDGRHRSTKMWYCRLYGIMMLQHLDAWEMPSAEAFQKSLLGFAA